MTWDHIAGQRGFSLDRLVTLCRVARCGGIAAAARAGLDLKKPEDQAVANSRQGQYSRQISELENALGGVDKVQLLDRRSRPAKLTPEGEELALLARNFFSGLEDYISARQTGEQRLVIGAGERLIQWLLMPDILPELRSSFPETTVLFLNRQTQDIVTGLKEGSLDLGLLRRGALTGTQLKSAGSWFEKYHFFVGADVSPKLPIPPTIADLNRYPLAVLEGAGETRASVVRLFARAQQIPNIQLECSSLTQVAQAVEMGFAAFLPDMAISRMGANIQVHRIEGLEDLDTEQTLAWNPERAKFRPIIPAVVKRLTNRGEMSPMMRNSQVVNRKPKN